MSKYKIGDRVRVKDYGSLPEYMRKDASSPDPLAFVGRKCAVCGLVGTVTDVLESSAHGCTMYQLHFDGYECRSNSFFTDDCLDSMQEDIFQEYSFSTEYSKDDNRVYAFLNHRKFDGSTEVVKSAYGIVVKDGLEGLAQATSYAMYTLYRLINIDESKKERK